MVSRAKAQSKTAVEQTLRLFTSTKKLVLVALLSLLACGKSNRMLTICVQADGGKTCEDLGHSVRAVRTVPVRRELQPRPARPAARRNGASGLADEDRHSGDVDVLGGALNMGQDGVSRGRALSDRF